MDQDRAYKRIVGYLKKTSPHMVERVVRHKEKQPLMEAYGVDAEIKSTLSRRVDLPSGGYLIFDYAEAFTVIDVNTGRFVGSRSRSSAARLEDTITKNNLEAVKEVVRQLRLRDIGGIIVIDFIDMANPKNRATVEEALRTELERDRTKTYVVEISPLGLVEMTRQNVTDGPREVMTKKCPTCGGDGIVVSETSAAVEIERRLRALAAGSRHQAYRVEVAAKVASILIGPGASRLIELEEQTRRRFYLTPRTTCISTTSSCSPRASARSSRRTRRSKRERRVEMQLVEVGLHDPEAGVGKLDGLDVCVAGAAKLVGKKVKAQIERVLDGTAYATSGRRAPPRSTSRSLPRARPRSRRASPRRRRTRQSVEEATPDEWKATSLKRLAAAAEAERRRGRRRRRRAAARAVVAGGRRRRRRGFGPGP